MHIVELEVPGAYRIDPELLADTRGAFYETVRYQLLRELTGMDFVVRQVNHSVSAANVLRGLHSTPGEAKIVSCVRGAAFDVAVDIRAGSPTFGRSCATRLDSTRGTAVFLPDGFAHGFLALTDDTCMSYLCSQEYVPGTMLSFDALDPELALPWPAFAAPPIRSAKDAAAPPLGRSKAASAASAAGSGAR